MEAPEKIYLCPSELAGIDYDEEWLESPLDDSIEYTRTDAFIKKAERWLKEIHRACDITDENGYRIDLRELQARFENYMKG